MSRDPTCAETCHANRGGLRDVTRPNIRWERGSCAYVPGSACTRALRETACAEKTDAYAEERHVREQRHAYAEERHVREQRHVRSEDTHAVNPIR